MSLSLSLPRYKQRSDPRTGEHYYEHRAVAEWKLGRPLLPRGEKLLREQTTNLARDLNDEHIHSENPFCFRTSRRSQASPSRPRPPLRTSSETGGGERPRRNRYQDGLDKPPNTLKSASTRSSPL